MIRSVFVPSARLSAAGRYSGMALVALAVAVLSACATQPQGGTTVEDRARQRWEALLSADLDSAYAYYSPGYRSAHSRVDFEIGLRTRRIQWTSASVEGSQCEGDRCTVTTRVGYRIGSPVPGVPKWESERLIEERWVRTEGQWWFVPDD